MRCLITIGATYGIYWASKHFADSLSIIYTPGLLNQRYYEYVQPSHNFRYFLFQKNRPLSH